MVWDFSASAPVSPRLEHLQHQLRCLADAEAKLLELWGGELLASKPRFSMGFSIGVRWLFQKLDSLNMLEISILDFGNDLGDTTIFWSSHVMCQAGNLEKFMGAKMGGWIMKDGKKPSEMIRESRDTSSSLKNMWKRNTVIKSTQTWWCKEEWSECQHQECDTSGRNRDNGILLSKMDMSPSAWEILCVSCGERTTTS